MKKSLVLIIIGVIIFLCLIIISIVILFVPNSPINKWIIKAGITDENFPENNPNQNKNPAGESDSNPSTGGGSVGGGTSSGGGSGNSNNCISRKIPFSIGELVILEECLDYEGNNCVEKNVECSINIKNQDDEISGTFKGEISFFEKGHPTNLIDTFLFEEYLGPGEETSVIATTYISDDEIANLEIECIYQTTETPEEEICS